MTATAVAGEWAGRYRAWCHRVVANFLMSQDVAKRGQLTNALTLYRITFAQPRQDGCAKLKWAYLERWCWVEIIEHPASRYALRRQAGKPLSPPCVRW